MSQKTVGGRFNVMTFGLVTGFLVGLYLIKDYKLVKYSPPNPENFDENGNWKEKSFIKVRLRDVQPLERKDAPSESVETTPPVATATSEEP